MISNDDFDRILSELLQETAEDLVGLWLLQKWVERAARAEPDPLAVRAATLAIIDRAIDSGNVVAGSFTGKDFQTWTPDSAEVRRRIEAVWSVASRELAPADNVWLSGRDLNYRSMK